MPESKTYEIYTEVTVFIRANGEQHANFTTSGRSTGNSTAGLPKAIAPALADALAASSRLTTAMEGE